jgi:hypothetical protein
MARCLLTLTSAGESGVSCRSASANSARRIRINSASDAVVIARRDCRRADRRCADRGSACADAYADIPARVAAMISTAVDATDVSAAMERSAVTASVESAEMIATKSAAAAAASHGIGRNTSDAEHCGRGN